MVSTDTEWNRTCLKERGRILHGPYAHYCFDWDGLTVDATTPEFSCCTSYNGFWFKVMRFISSKFWDFKSK